MNLKLLKEIFVDLEKDGVSFKGLTSDIKKYKTLYHYITAKSLKSIIEHKKLWLSRSEYLNDDSEIIFSKNIIKEAISEYEKEKNTKIFSPKFISFDNNSDLTDKSYICSFSTNSDSLPLWYNYANCDGYCIGFDSNELNNKLKSLIQKTASDEKHNTTYMVLAGKVIYNKTEQINRIKFLIDKRETLAKKSQEEIELSRYCIEYLILQTIFFMKHSQFSCEEEYRIVIWKDIPYRDSSLKFRTDHGLFIPYIELDIANEKESLEESTIIKINSITTGPRIKSAEAKKSLKLFLEHQKLSDIEIISSDIPLRY